MENFEEVIERTQSRVKSGEPLNPGQIELVDASLDLLKLRLRSSEGTENWLRCCQKEAFEYLRICTEQTMKDVLNENDEERIDVEYKYGKEGTLSITDQEILKLVKEKNEKGLWEIIGDKSQTEERRIEAVVGIDAIQSETLGIAPEDRELPDETTLFDF